MAWEYASRSDLLGFADRLTLTEQASVRRRAERQSTVKASFLSHSTADSALVVGAVRLLEMHGATVYIDKKDPSLPPYTDKDTAAGLKSRIRQSSTFVLLASDNSKDSRWVPWELGLADGNKGLRRVAILPTVRDGGSSDWAEWEYLGLYDRIVWGDLEGEREPVWMVLDAEANRASTLRKWLAQ